jgi:hypothetical protein
MRIKSQDAKNHPSYKARALLKLSNKVHKMTSSLENRAEDLTLDVIAGLSTGDKLLDFALVACGGVYDADIVEKQYRQLTNLALEHAGERVMVIKKGRVHINGEQVYLRTIYLACLRSDELDVDIEAQTMRLPVMPKGFVWRDFLHNNRLQGVGLITDAEWVRIGPLHNYLTNYNIAMKVTELTIAVKGDAVCDVVLLPVEDGLSLYKLHGLHPKTIKLFHNLWTRKKSEDIK